MPPSCDASLISNLRRGAPDMVEAILNSHQPHELPIEKLKRPSL